MPKKTRSKTVDDFAHCLRNLKQCAGVLVREQGELWLLSEPAPLVPEPLKLAAALLEPTLPTRHDLQAFLGARAAFAVTPSWLGQRAYALKHVSRNVTALTALIEQGAPSLNAYRRVDCEALLKGYGQRLEVLSRLGAAEPESPGVWHLDQRMHVLSDDLELRSVTDIMLKGYLSAKTLDTLFVHPNAGLRGLGAMIQGRYQRDGAVCVGDALRRWGQRAPYESFFSMAWVAPEFGEVMRAVPREAWRRWGYAFERLGTMCGGLAVENVLDCFAASFQKDALEKALDGFVAVCQKADTTRKGSRFVARLRELNAASEPDTGGFAALHLEWMRNHGFTTCPVNYWTLQGEAHLISVGGFKAAARSIRRLWLNFERSSDYPDEAPLSLGPSSTHLVRAMALAAARPELRLQDMWSIVLASEVDAWCVVVQLDRLKAKALYTRLVALLPSWLAQGRAVEVLPTHMELAFLTSNVPVDLLLRAIDLGLGVHVNDFVQHPRRLRRYIDGVEQVRGAKKSLGLNPKSAWFRNLFLHGHAWTLPLIATLIVIQDGTASLFALSQALGGLDPVLQAALETWGSPVCGLSKRDVEARAALFGVSADELVTYLHHRRLMGYGETLPQTLQDILGRRETLMGQVSWIDARLERGCPDAEHIKLKAQRARLMATINAKDTSAVIRKKARARLRRGLDVLRRESLYQVMDEVLCEKISDFIGLEVGVGQLSQPLRDALLLLQRKGTNLELWKTLLLSSVRGDSLETCPPNKQWLEEARRQGIDTDVWLGGFKEELRIGGQVVVVETERDPLRVLRMGSYFGTCLSLETGSNAASTLVNALDINKHVIYGRLEQGGPVVARLLVGATSKGFLGRYRTYVSEHALRKHLVPALEEVVQGFAERCGLTLSNSATPEVLHDGFWYDDGNRPWSALASDLLDQEALDALPEGMPRDTMALVEQAWFRALELDQPEALAALAQRNVKVWSGLARLRLMIDHPTFIDPENNPVGFDAVHLAVAYWYGGEQAGGRLPGARLNAREEFVAQTWGARRTLCVERLQAVAQRRHTMEWDDLQHHPADLLAVLPWLDIETLFRVVTLLDVIYEAFRKALVGDEDSERGPLGYWCACEWPCVAGQALRIIWFRDAPGEALRRALDDKKTCTVLVEKIAELAQDVQIPGLDRALRRRLKVASDALRPTLAMALGRQGVAQHGPYLLTLLREQPESLELALATVRCGDPESAEEARRLWVWPPQVESQSIEWFDKVVELAPLRLVRRAKRQIRMATYANEEDRQQARSYQLGRIEDVQEWSAIVAYLEASPDRETLEMLVTRNTYGAPARLSSSLYAIVVQNSCPTLRGLALEVLVCLSPFYGATAAMLGALLSEEERRRLPEDVRAKMAARSLRYALSRGRELGWFDAYTDWAAGCSVEVLRNAVNDHEIGLTSGGHRNGVVQAALLRLNDPDVGRAAVEFLCACVGERSDPLEVVQVLNRVYLWHGECDALEVLGERVRARSVYIPFECIQRIMTQLACRTLRWLFEHRCVGVKPRFLKMEGRVSDGDERAVRYRWLLPMMKDALP